MTRIVNKKEGLKWVRTYEVGLCIRGGDIDLSGTDQQTAPYR